MADLKWFHAMSREAETWDGPFDSRELAIADAAQIDKDFPIYVARGQPSTEELLDLLPSVDLLVEDLDLAAMDNAISGEDARVSCPDVPAATAALRVWAQTYLRIEEWYAIDMNTVELAREPGEEK